MRDFFWARSDIRERQTKSRERLCSATRVRAARAVNVNRRGVRGRIVREIARTSRRASRSFITCAGMERARVESVTDPEGAPDGAHGARATA
jgi:hypothetical protein